LQCWGGYYQPSCKLILHFKTQSDAGAEGFLWQYQLTLELSRKLDCHVWEQLCAATWPCHSRHQVNNLPPTYSQPSRQGNLQYEPQESFHSFTKWQHLCIQSTQARHRYFRKTLICQRPKRLWRTCCAEPDYKDYGSGHNKTSEIRLWCDFRCHTEQRQNTRYQEVQTSWHFWQWFTAIRVAQLRLPQFWQRRRRLLPMPWHVERNNNFHKSRQPGVHLFSFRYPPPKYWSLCRDSETAEDRHNVFWVHAQIVGLCRRQTSNFLELQYGQTCGFHSEHEWIPYNYAKKWWELRAALQRKRIFEA